ALSPFVVLQQFPILWLSRWMKVFVQRWSESRWTEVWKETKTKSWVGYEKFTPITTWCVGFLCQLLFWLSWVPEAASRPLGMVLTRKPTPKKEDVDKDPTAPRPVLREGVGRPLALLLIAFAGFTLFVGASADTSRWYPLPGPAC